MKLKNTISLLYELNKKQKQIIKMLDLSSEELKNIQSKKLKKIVKHAYENVDLYKEKYDKAGIIPEDIQSIDDLYKLPIITKADIKSGYPDKVLAKNIDKNDCYIISTTGSTGIPLKIFYEKKDFLEDIACTSPTLIHKWTNRKMKKIITFLVRDINAAEEVFIKEIPKIFLRNFYFGDALSKPKEQILAIQKFKPDVIFTYPSVLRNIYSEVQKNKIKIFQPKFILTTAEIFDKPTRELLSSIFTNTEFFDLYGTTEGGRAIECKNHNGLHILAWNNIFEILDKDGKSLPNGFSGRIIFTNLYSKATPIIRYSGLGDLAVLSNKPCSCGSSLPMLKRIEGRIIDSILLKNNRIVHPFHLTLLMQNIQGIYKFQIRQEKINKIRILIVKNEHSNVLKDVSYLFEENNEYKKKIINRFKEILGEDVDILFEKVDDIPLDSDSHKFRRVVSKVSREKLKY
jgi:phenylacetate-CoA ligase